jgi:uncharacterized SAM-binding protein YcdF (DUF218 family)
MFVLSKIIAFLTQPLVWVFALLVWSLLWHGRNPRAAQRLGWSALSLWLVMAWQPLPDYLLRGLENQYTEISPQADLSGYYGVLVLGGATESGAIAQSHVQPLLNGAAERMTSAVALMQRNTHLRMVFTGGEGALFGSGPSEADRAKMFFDSLGLNGPQVQYESKSRNTYENAVLSAQLPGMDVQKRWLLVTSASHMPRSMATFQKAGWNVTAYPVDFNTGNDLPWTSFALAGVPGRWEMLLHEYAGLLAYRLTGRM